MHHAPAIDLSNTVAFVESSIEKYIRNDRLLAGDSTVAVLFGINSTRDASNSTLLRLVLLRASLVLLISNSNANRAITYTNRMLPL